MSEDTRHEIRASGGVWVALYDPDGHGTFGDIRVKDIDIDNGSYRCVCGETFVDGAEAAAHIMEMR